MNEGHGKNNVLRDRMRRSVLERGVHKVIGIKGIPVYAIVQIGHSKNLPIRGYSRTTPESSRVEWVSVVSISQE